MHPDNADRRLALGAMVESIRKINRANILALGLTVRLTWSRLNVGRAGWGFFAPAGIGLIVQEGAVHEFTAAQTQRVSPTPADFAALRSSRTHGFRYAIAPLHNLADIYPLSRESHCWVVRELAKQVSRTPYYTSHSSGATAYMQEFLGIDVPDPEH